MAALRFVLAVDDDHSEFLRRFRADPMLGPATRTLAGLRPIRVATVAQSLLRALCGQLIETKRARFLERRIVRTVMPAHGSLHEPPTAAALARLSPAELRRLGLHARRGATLVRVCSSLDLERLRGLPAETVSARLERERGLGPWSVGVIALEGLGRYDLGIVGDLGLIKLLSLMRGRRVEAWETEELLAPYGEWAGLASAYMLLAWARGLLPVSPAARFAA
jgi:3-methyladenine DNA glycosylase/8-oxoguanine DNA glycosylase